MVGTSCHGYSEIPTSFSAKQLAEGLLFRDPGVSFGGGKKRKRERERKRKKELTAVFKITKTFFKHFY